METKWFTQSHTGNYQRSKQFIPSHSKQSDVLFSVAETNPISPAALPLGLPDMESNASSIPTGLRAFCSYRHWSYPSQPNVVGVWLAPCLSMGTELEGMSGQRKHLSSDKSFPLLVPSLLLVAFSTSRCLLRKHLLECFFLLNSNQFVQIISWRSVHQVHPDTCHLYRNQKFL